jgi:hypothetical protein
MSKKDAKFDALASRLTDPKTELASPTDVATGDRAADRGRVLMVSEYGSDEAVDTMLHRAGRPRLGERSRGVSPTVRGRIPEVEHVAFEQLMRLTGKKESELVREAVHLLLEQHQLAS